MIWARYSVDVQFNATRLQGSYGLWNKLPLQQHIQRRNSSTGSTAIVQCGLKQLRQLETQESHVIEALPIQGHAQPAQVMQKYLRTTRTTVFKPAQRADRTGKEWMKELLPTMEHMSRSTSRYRSWSDEGWGALPQVAKIGLNA